MEKRSVIIRVIARETLSKGVETRSVNPVETAVLLPVLRTTWWFGEEKDGGSLPQLSNRSRSLRLIRLGNSSVETLLIVKLVAIICINLRAIREDNKA